MNLRVGSLVEPLTGRRWDPARIQGEYRNRLAYFQRQGLAPADLVFIHYGNTLELFVDLLAIWTLGGCAVPLDPQLTHFEVETLAQAAAPRFSLWRGEVDSGASARLEALGVKVIQTAAATKEGECTHPEPYSPDLLSLDQPALVLFTSGTTGQPKGVVHTHRSLLALWMNLRNRLDIEKFCRTLCLLPTHFGHGLICNCLFPWLSGQDLFIIPSGRTELVMQLGSLLDDCGITSMSSVPAIWRLALKLGKPPTLGRLEQVFCGSAPLSALLWKGIQEWTGTKDVINAYGITETGSWVAGTAANGVTLEDGLVGPPWGAEIRILKSSGTTPPPSLASECVGGEPGYVWLKTPALMKGYLGREDLTNQAVSEGWFSTGDIGLVNDRGMLYLRGREREEINRGGTKVYPGDIDAVAEQYDQTLDVCTFGYEDPLLGENVGIAVVLRSASEENLRELYNGLKERVARFQMPQRWYLLDQIPRTPRGKINRSKVARICAELQPVDHHKLVRGGS